MDTPPRCLSRQRLLTRSPHGLRSARVLLAMWLGIVGCLATRFARSAPTSAESESSDPEAGDSWAEARKLSLRGEYRRAESMFKRLQKADAVRAALGVTACLRATGNDDRAATVLADALAEHPEAAALHSMRAEFALAAGEYEKADQAAAAAIRLNSEELSARWTQSELHRLRGEMKAAADGYHWFVRYYNDHDVTDPDATRWVGLAAGQYARWNRLNDQFSFVVNELLPAARERESDYWPSHYETARLFLEKYNEVDATREIDAGLAINPHSAELHALRGELALHGYELDRAATAAQRALEINPRLLAAHRLQADIHLANVDVHRAIEVLSAALPLNMADEETLGRLAACYAVLDGGVVPTPESRAGQIAAQVEVVNSHAGRFCEACGDACDALRRYPLAAHYYEMAVQKMPQLTAAHGKLGMVLMRLGEEDRARTILDAAFDADPFNVRVQNTLKVLKVLAGYETLETPHFLVRFDPQRDRITARLVAQRLEQTYPRLCEKFGYEPQGKSLFELFSKSGATDGHGWFSARTVGLPRIHTIGACAGKIVAMQSPTDGARRFNWARVLEHEFVHVLNLQQTNFGVSHWHTEALATLAEGYPRPPGWDQLLARRHAEGKLYTLDTINMGFIRPHNSDDWTMAYCQARLYAEYAAERFGADAAAKMLAGYADNLSTAATLQRAFGVTQQEFERGFGEFIERLVASVPRAESSVENATRPLRQILSALEANPRNPDLLAELADAHRVKKNIPRAIECCEQALAIDPRHTAAIAARARLHQAVGENEQAWTLLASAIDEAQPSLELVRILASGYFKAERTEEAAKWFEFGMRHAPNDAKWVKALAAVYLKSGDNARLRPLLEQLALWDADDLAIRRKLTEIALAARDSAAAAKYAESCLEIDVLDDEAHGALGESLLLGGKPEAALAAIEPAIELRPGKLKYRLTQARAWLAVGERDKAREAARDILNRDPKHPDAQSLLESLEQ